MPPPGRRARLRTAALAATVLVLAAWWLQPAAPPAPGPDPSPIGREPPTRTELQQWANAVDQRLPHADGSPGWGHAPVQPGPDPIDLIDPSDDPVEPGRYLLELACGGQGELLVVVHTGTARHRLPVICTSDAPLRRVPRLELADRFTLQFQPGHATGRIGYRLTPYRIVSTLWRHRAQMLLPLPQPGVLASGGGPLWPGRPAVTGLHPAGAGPRQVAVLCAGRGTVLVITRPGRAGLPRAVPIKCTELPLARTVELPLGQTGPVRVTLTPTAETLAWVRYVVTGS